MDKPKEPMKTYPIILVVVMSSIGCRIIPKKVKKELEPKPITEIFNKFYFIKLTCKEFDTCSYCTYSCCNARLEGPVGGLELQQDFCPPLVTFGF